MTDQGLMRRKEERSKSWILLALVLALPLSGCAVVSVGSAAVSLGATAVKTTGKAAGTAVDVTGSAVGLGIPDGDDQEGETDRDSAKP